MMSFFTSKRTKLLLDRAIDISEFRSVLYDYFNTEDEVQLSKLLEEILLDEEEFNLFCYNIKRGPNEVIELLVLCGFDIMGERNIITSLKKIIKHLEADAEA